MQEELYCAVKLLPDFTENVGGHIL